MKELHIETTKTARIYTLGELTQHTKQVWIVLHGFGQNAQSFLTNFEPVLNEDRFFIAPEALNRFYLKGPGGNVGATWMTKEDRLNEMKDYINYLDNVYSYLRLEYFNGNITVLGFSQGASTITRWVNATTKRIDRLIVYAGEVGPELIPLAQGSGLRNTKNVFICGNEDEIFTSELVAQMKVTYEGMNFEEKEFTGKHELNTEILKEYLL